LETARRKRNQPISAWIPAKLLRKLKEESKFRSHTLTDEVVESLSHYSLHLKTGLTLKFEKHLLENYDYLLDSMKKTRFLNFDEFLFNAFIEGYQKMIEDD